MTFIFTPNKDHSDVAAAGVAAAVAVAVIVVVALLQVEHPSALGAADNTVCPCVGGASVRWRWRGPEYARFDSTRLDSTRLGRDD